MRHAKPWTSLSNWYRSLRHTNQRAVKDAIILAAACVVAWVLIERTDTCTRFFRYVADNPDLELDSIILAGMFAAVGLLVFAVRRWSDMARAERHADLLARRDPLTGLPNRREFIAALAKATSRQNSRPFACLLADLDSFKDVNDLHGHLAGDELLSMLSARLRQELAADILLARIGGDEFALLVPLHDPNRIMEVSNQVMRVVCEPQQIEGSVVQVGLSIGVAQYPGDAARYSSLLRKSDIALYRAKQRKRSIQIFEPGMEDADRRRARISAELQGAIPRGELVPHYQPLIDLKTGNVIGAEVLSRWFSPNLGSVSPAEFIPIASNSGLIGKLCCSVFEQACSDAAQWSRALSVSFNFAPRQLCDPALPLQLMSFLGKTGLSPLRLDIEMTEDALLENDKVARANLENLRTYGIKLTLDDFGTGYSSLYHLRLLPFDRLKIDRSYVGKITTCETSRLMVEAIIQLCHALSLPVLAEGVETAEQERILIELGCDQAQGWLYGKAMPQAEFQDFLLQSAPAQSSALRA